MRKKILTTLLTFASFFCFSQQTNLIIETDSISIYETDISINAKNNIFPTIYKDGLLYCSDGNLGYRLFYSDMENRKRISGTGLRYVFGPAAVYNDEIYFNRYSTKSSAEGAFNVALFKGEIKNFKITKTERLDFSKVEYAYSHPAISKDGNSMVVVTNEEGLFHLQGLKRNADNKWVKNEVIYIAQGPGELIHPSFYDDNTIYFAANDYDGAVEEIENIYEDGKIVATDVYRKASDFDIYKLERINGIWRLPIKVSVLNSEFDDLGVVFTGPNKGYISTYRYNDNDNIYYFELKQ